MTRKIVISLLLNFLVSVLFADWREDLSGIMTEKKDYREASDYLVSSYEKIDPEDRHLVCVLLAYLFDKLGETNNEHRWIKEYFEVYLGRDALIHFLNESTNRDIKTYIEKWKNIYPLVLSIYLLHSEQFDGLSPPGVLPLEIDIKNKSYFRLSFH
ncbi:MAG: hypothetical protein ACOC6P_03780 [Candidatus Aminicenantaceae bacterium]